METGKDRTTVSKPRVLCLHGFRTSGSILKLQMAAMAHHVNADFVFIDAPHAAGGPPDQGVQTFYPKMSYFEWFYT